MPPANTPHPRLHLGHPDHHLPGYEFPVAASTPLSRKTCLLGFLLAAGIALLGWTLKHAGEGAIVPDVSPLWLLPFIALLGSIAILPFIAKHFWEKNYHYLSLALGLLVTAYYLFGLHAPKIMAETFADYISFIFLLGSLFVVSGGVVIRIRKHASPSLNTLLLLLGSLLANVFGTTGAAMLLIRPFLRLNHGRVKPYHIVFFIFSVANIGGGLTPVGDPPLFLGYLRGVPFWWVAQHGLPIWLTAIGCLLALFFLIDSLNTPRTEKSPPAASAEKPAHATLSLFGGANLLFISLILLAVFLDAPFRELLMAAAAFGSLATTSPRIYGDNHFNHAPIREVALLFLGIFATMVPAMNYLHNHANDPAFKRALNTPGQFYFVCGSLSSVLDNAPTYITFLETSLGQFNDPHAPGDDIPTRLNDPRPFPGGAASFSQFLIAISMSAVFFGAATYIGNGPNFMVKSIADHAGIPTPGFFRYILLYTLPILLPILLLCWYLYLR